mgnify:CR=1 FL=1
MRKLSEWAHRRIQQIRQLPDPQQEEGQQAPPMRLGRQPQTRGKKRKAACAWGDSPNAWQEKEGRDREEEEEEVRRRFARPGWMT